MDGRGLLIFSAALFMEERLIRRFQDINGVPSPPPIVLDDWLLPTLGVIVPEIIWTTVCRRSAENQFIGWINHSFHRK
jgi:hypothetical protein